MPDHIEVTSSRPERALLIGLCREARERPFEEESLRELRELTRSAGTQVVDVFLQERARPDPAYLVGKGKAEELHEAILGYAADLAVFDLDLTPAQLRNLEELLEVKVIDRSELILDIFAQRARSREGKLQVELAQLEYMLPRLTGRGTVLSRLGGGIGTRGPGETKLEADRRTIRTRLSRIRRDLERLESRRQLHRRKRQSVPIPTVSLVGYTNAGKSTLFNRLTHEQSYVSDRLFATLDPLVRRIRLESGQEILISDTVGFIRKLPHTLVAAFHATLEETLEADLILHVVDRSHPNWPSFRNSVYEVLEEIGLEENPVLEAHNKMDLLPGPLTLEDGGRQAAISALRGDGMEGLLELIASSLNRNHRKVRLRIPFERGEIVSQLRNRAQVLEQEYGEDGTRILALLPLADLGRFSHFVEEDHVSSRHRRQAECR